MYISIHSTCIWGDTAVRLSQQTLKSNSFSKYTESPRIILPADEDRPIALIGCAQLDAAVAQLVNALECSVVVDQNGGNRAIIHEILLFDENNVAVVDARFNHRIAFAAEREVAVYIITQRDGNGIILVGEDGFAAGNAAEEGNGTTRDGDRFGMGKRFFALLRDHWDINSHEPNRIDTKGKT